MAGISFITHKGVKILYEDAPYIKCAAVYGVDGLKEVVFKSVLAFTGRNNLVLCKTLEEGKDYLASMR
ncbi:MAG: hypothetical protein WBN66_07320 [Smithella sp.]